MSGFRPAQAQFQGISAGTQSTPVGPVTLAASNGVSFGMSGSTQITASVATATMSYFENYKAMALGANAAAMNSGQSNLSLQRVFVPWNVQATQLDLLGNLTANSGSTGSYTWAVGVYSYRNSTQASILSSATASFSYTGGTNSTTSTVYGAHSGTRLRSLSLATWNFTPGEYMFGIMASVSAPAAGLTLFGQSSVSIGPDIGVTHLSKYWADGVLRTATAALPSTIHRSAIAQTGSIPLRQPYFRLVGTF